MDSGLLGFSPSWVAVHSTLCRSHILSSFTCDPLRAWRGCGLLRWPCSLLQTASYWLHPQSEGTSRPCRVHPSPGGGSWGLRSHGQSNLRSRQQAAVRWRHFVQGHCFDAVYGDSATWHLMLLDNLSSHQDTPPGAWFERIICIFDDCRCGFQSHNSTCTNLQSGAAESFNASGTLVTEHFPFAPFPSPAQVSVSAGHPVHWGVGVPTVK